MGDDDEVFGVFVDGEAGGLDFDEGLFVHFFGEFDLAFEGFEIIDLGIELLGGEAGDGFLEAGDLAAQGGDGIAQGAHLGGAALLADEPALVGDLFFDEFTLEGGQEGAFGLDIDLGVEGVVAGLVGDEFTDGIDKALLVFGLLFFEKLQGHFGVFLFKSVENLL